MQDPTEARPVSRREFLKMAGVAGAMLGAGATFGGLFAACGSASTTTTTAAETATTATTAGTAATTATSAVANSIGPFSGTGPRTQLVVISDLHMGADMAYSEFNNNRTPLVNFLGQVRESPTVKELVIAGDLLDEWFVPGHDGHLCRKRPGRFRQEGRVDQPGGGRRLQPDHPGGEVSGSPTSPATTT